MINLLIKEEESGQTIEKYVKKVLKNAPLSFIYKLFRKKDIKINGHWVNKNVVVNYGDNISIYITDSQLEEFKKKKILSSTDEISKMIIYEDKNIIVINKPRGLLVTRDETNSKSLDQMVLNYLYYKKEFDPETDLAFTPGPAHRLDRNTSGIVLFGKNIETLQYLFKILKEKNDIAKRYLALVNGIIDDDGAVEAPLKKDEQTGLVHVCSVNDGGKKSKTIYKIKEKYRDHTLLDVLIVTGRTHQIRVHMAYICHSVVGDRKYGDFSKNLLFKEKFHFENQFLHAYHLSFGKLEPPLEYLSKKSFNACLNDEQEKILNKLRTENDIINE